MLPNVLDLRKKVQVLALDRHALLGDEYDAVLAHFNGIIVDANEATARALECEVEDLIGYNAFTLYHHDSVQKVMAHVKSKSEEPYQVHGYTLKHNEIYVEMKAVNFSIDGEDGRLIGFKKIAKF